MIPENILLGYKIGTGDAVDVPIRHLAVTGQTQQSGKTTTLEALVSRSGLTALTFVTKRGEGSFAEGRRVTPYFRDRADWQFVTSIIDATLQEKNKYLRQWIIKICRTTRTLAEVQQKVREELKTARGQNEGAYTQIDAYLDLIVPEIERARLAEKLDLRHGLNVMDVSSFATPMQMLFIQSALDWVNEHCRDTIVVVPEAWEFVPEGKGSPVKASAIALVRKGAGVGNHIWIDSQDMAGVDKTILRGCTVWLIGAQREANEIKRNLSNIPTGINRPKPSEISLLERGQFFACFGRTVAKVYVRPAWMPEREAISIARGQSEAVSKPPLAPVFASKPIEQTEDRDVKESEAAALRNENADLKRRLAALESGNQPPPVSVAPTSGTDMDAIYAEVKRRIKAEPEMIALMQAKPEIVVSITRPTINADYEKQPGILAGMIAEGRFDKPTGASDVVAELKRRGRAVHNANVYRDLNRLAEQGFLTIEDEGYQAVKGMKVRIVGA